MRGGIYGLVFLVVVFYHICFCQGHLILILTCFNWYMDMSRQETTRAIPRALEPYNPPRPPKISLLSISNQVTELFPPAKKKKKKNRDAVWLRKHKTIRRNLKSSSHAPPQTYWIRISGANMLKICAFKWLPQVVQCLARFWNHPWSELELFSFQNRSINRSIEVS